MDEGRGSLAGCFETPADTAVQEETHGEDTGNLARTL